MATKKYRADIDLCGNRILSLVLEGVPSLPENPVEARIVYDEGEKKIAYYDGENWVHLSDVKSVQNLSQLLQVLEKTVSTFDSRITDTEAQVTTSLTLVSAMMEGNVNTQFRFVDDMESPSPVGHKVTLDKEADTITAPAGIIQHMTLGITDVSPAHNPTEYKFWSLPEFTSGALEADKRYYLYAKVSKADQSGVFLLSEDTVDFEEVDGYYHLLVGILNASVNGARIYESVYRFISVTPAEIAIDKLRDPAGNLVIDLANSEIVAKNGAKIIGNLTIGTGSSGLENFTEWKDKQALIDKTVAKTDVLYYLSDSATELSGGSWVTEPPAWVNGKYMWSKTKTTYTSGSSSETDPVCIAGATGSTGTPGSDGKGISSMQEYYYLSTSTTELTPPDRKAIKETRVTRVTRAIPDPPAHLSWPNTRPTGLRGMTPSCLETSTCAPPRTTGTHGRQPSRLSVPTVPRVRKEIKAPRGRQVRKGLKGTPEQPGPKVTRGTQVPPARVSSQQP